MIDLHCHSTYSDGSCTPAELAARAAAVGVTALALTDHDGIDGVAPFLEACAAVSNGHVVEGIPGVEISAEVPRGTLHLLAYFVDTGHTGLQQALRRIREGRAERNHHVLRRLNELGCALDWDAVTRHAGGEVVGRPHFAQALVEAGHVRNRRSAFDKLLARGRPAYVERFRFPPATAIQVILDAGGVPVLAHPASLELSPSALRREVRALKKLGLQGVEVYYPLHAPEQQGLYAAVARELDLVGTGGSDFHGAANPAIELGRGFGGLRVPAEVVQQLRARAGGGAR